MKKLNNLQSLRGISAMLVLFYHSSFFSNNIFGFNLWETFFSKGYLGVQVFFIISGFIMVITTNDDNSIPNYKKTINFLLKRIIRIVPLYYFTTIFMAILSSKAALYFFGDLKFELIKSLLFIPYSNFPILIVGWSLNYEMFFYVLFALSLLNFKNRYYILLVFYFLILFLRLYFSFDSFAFKMIINPHIDYFVVGVCLGLIYDKIFIKNIVLKSMSILSITLFSLLLTKVINAENHFVELSIISFFTISIILFDYKKVTVNPPKFLIFLGDISYSIYLAHLFFIIFFTQIAEKFKIEYKLLPFILLIITIIGVSKISYELIEKRFTKYITSKIF